MTKKPHGLLMRNNEGGAEMVTPVDEVIRTVTAKCNQSLLVPYNGTGGRAVRAATEPVGTIIGSDRWAKLDPATFVDDCGFRMLEPHEVAAAMAFPDGYIPTDLSKKDRVKLAGNAVTPPVMAWLVGRVAQALGTDNDLTATDLFCGAGGSSLGAEAGGATLVMAANHWQTAIDVHQANFPNAGHDCADVSQADPRRYPRTNLLIASPECTNHSQARGVSRRRQDPSLFDAPDPAAERSRATMWDVVRFAEQLRYEAVIVENVVEATKWVLFGAWWTAMESLGYHGTVLSHNSMFHGVPQSRDRLYIVWTLNGIRPDLELEVTAWCPKCETVGACRQSWKQGRRSGRYRQQWLWRCTVCLTAVEPLTEPAASIIDWSLPCPRIGDRAKPLAPKTRDRILAGLQRYGWAPIITAGAGHVHERTPGNRARSVDDPLPAQQATASSALAMAPDGFLYQTAHGGRVTDFGRPHPTVCGSDDRQALVLTNRAHSIPLDVAEPMTTLCAAGNHHALITT